jgi:hypothetical protein
LCVLHYSNQDFLLSTRSTSDDDDFDDILVLRKSPQNASTSAAVFDAAVGVLINTTADYAATSPIWYRHASGYPNNLRLGAERPKPDASRVREVPGIRCW